MQKAEKSSTVMVQRYLTALEAIKTKTLVEEAVLVPTKDFAAEYKVNDAFLIILSRKFDMIERVKTGMSFTYKWKFGDTKLNAELAEKVYLECNDWVKKGSKERNGVKEGITPKAAVVITPKPPTEPVFTIGHLKVMKHLLFNKPTEVHIDDTFKAYNIKRVEFEAETGVVLFKFVVDRVVKKEDGTIHMDDFITCTLQFNNRGFQLHPRYESKDSGAYKITTVARA